MKFSIRLVALGSGGATITGLRAHAQAYAS